MGRIRKELAKADGAKRVTEKATLDCLSREMLGKIAPININIKIR